MEKKINEDCIQQIYRLYSTRLYSSAPDAVDRNGHIRMDEWEMRDDVQTEVKKCWELISDENLYQTTDLVGYKKDFLNLFGFNLDGVNYDADVETDLKLPSSL